MELLHKTADVLIEREKIDGEEFDKLWNGEDLPPIDETEPKKEIPQGKDGKSESGQGDEPAGDEKKADLPEKEE
jgi:cell division protease FtsH